MLSLQVYRGVSGGCSLLRDVMHVQAPTVLGSWLPHFPVGSFENGFEPSFAGFPFTTPDMCIGYDYG